MLLECGLGKSATTSSTTLQLVEQVKLYPEPNNTHLAFRMTFFHDKTSRWRNYARQVQYDFPFLLHRYVQNNSYIASSHISV
jgi:hypothetical protein